MKQINTRALLIYNLYLINRKHEERGSGMEADKKQYRYRNLGTSYIDGNTVRKLSAVPEREREHEQHEIPSRRRQEQVSPKTLSGINLASLMVLCVAIIATLYMCVEYLKLQSDVSQMNNQIVTMENKLSEMTKANVAAYEAINKKYDLDYVYKVAVNDLGMVYPNENKVITYKKGKADYVRQYKDIPK